MSNQEKINILLVDDRPENLIAIEAIIEKDEYNLIKASSGEEALKHLLKYKVALILLDVQMPGMDGFSTAKIIKAREKTKDIPILFITANNMESEHIFMGYSVGAIDYILKPVDPLVLKAKVEGFVDIYKMKQQLLQQAQTLIDKTKQLEETNAQLNEMTGKLRFSEELASAINETSIDSMFILDRDGIILRCNPSVNNIFFHIGTELIGENISILFTDEESKKYINCLLTNIQHTGNLQGVEKQKEVVATRKNGSTFLAEVQFGLKTVSDIIIVACTIRDITKQKKNEELIKHMAYHDFLTDLPNRRSLNVTLTEYLRHAKKYNQSLGVLFLDMDRFKNINDSLGHMIGDRVLREVSNRLLDTVREKDFVSRVSGDEFSIILPNTDREGSLEIAENIISSFQKPFIIDNFELYLTTSIGLSIFPYDGDNVAELMKNADTALYRAKEQGKNKYNVFHTGMNMQTYRSFIMQNDLRKAIENEELELYYQPRINLQNQQVLGAEALIRWNHPNWGIVRPNEFIPLAEETGQIIPIGEWVLRSVCEQICSWENTELSPIRIAVNFSAKQFLQVDLIERIQQILDETQVNPQLLEIEITESVLLKNEELTLKTLQLLRKMGISISIDDFGTGYSSLHYLSHLPLNSLKIDQSFVQGITENERKNKSIITSIISLAKSLNLSVIAEGVETTEQLHFLASQNCDEIQGYLCSPPVPALQFIEAIQNNAFVPMISERKHTAVTDISQMSATMEEAERQNIIKEALAQIKELYRTTSRELEVFELILAGLSNKEISEKLFISEHTVKNHISKIFQKLQVNDRAQAMAMVYQLCIQEGEGLANE
ncbi:EAL domain-containing protein [Oceanobacillus halophilus]|uniref:EAL domain-containing protein n=1 Tax=Oceanobacillus halophilus TaxID=930130 RepID=A0A495A736_9BACI|nr:EAL domain-containing protein [Oceanobacillus halophilus]RKQ35620.1 EAL domain-containing protein [Oceanobacillus halophilus]